VADQGKSEYDAASAIFDKLKNNPDFTDRYVEEGVAVEDEGWGYPTTSPDDALHFWSKRPSAQ
jgi:hypothetical protein